MLLELHNNICEQIKNEIPEIQTCCSYPRIRCELIAPACFVEIESFDMGADPGTEELAVIANFEAMIVIDRTIENSSIAIRNLALRLAEFINHNTWNSKVTPAKIKSCNIDAFSPELDAYFVWNVSWTHELHVGENIWKVSGLQPHTIILNGEVLL